MITIAAEVVFPEPEGDEVAVHKNVLQKKPEADSASDCSSRICKPLLNP
jgi:hypothetical protein